MQGASKKHLIWGLSYSPLAAFKNVVKDYLQSCIPEHWQALTVAVSKGLAASTPKTAVLKKSMGFLL